MGEEQTTSNELTDLEMDNLVAQTEYDENAINRDSNIHEANTTNAFRKVLKVDGKEIEVDSEDKLIQYAQQGYDYAQKMNMLKNDRNAFDEKYQLYENIDKYATDNPDWWNEVTASYNNRNNQSTFKPEGIEPKTDKIDNNVSPEIQELKNELQELREFKNDILFERESARREREDAQLEKEIKDLKESYSNLSWEEQDENGKKLETKILEHANKNGINSFKAAFRDLCHDQLVEAEKLKAKEEFIGQMRQQKKMGILGETPTTVKNALSSSSNIKNKSYDSLFEEALSELQIE